MKKSFLLKRIIKADILYRRCPQCGAEGYDGDQCWCCGHLDEDPVDESDGF